MFQKRNNYVQTMDPILSTISTSGNQQCAHLKAQKQENIVRDILKSMLLTNKVEKYFFKNT
jgi:hypothetical protein